MTHTIPAYLLQHQTIRVVVIGCDGNGSVISDGASLHPPSAPRSRTSRRTRRDPDRRRHCLAIELRPPTLQPVRKSG